MVSGKEADMTHNWTSFTKAAENKTIICYGAGINASLMLLNDIFKPYLDSILFFVDRNPNVQGKKIDAAEKQYDILSTDALDKIGEDHIVLVTITDYLNTGEMLDAKGIEWYPWTVISTDYSISELDILDRSDEPHYFLLNTPDYMNLGDHAITIAENEYLHSIVGDIHEFGTNICHPEGIRKLSRHVKNNDVIFIQGGGNMGSLWRVCEENIRNIVRSFPDNRIVIFPQSVYYEDTPEAREYFRSSTEVYNGHKDLLICTRDRRSYDFVSESYSCGCMLLPDMVLTLKNEHRQPRKGVGVLIRDDKEKLIPKDYGSVISDAIKACGKETVNITHHPIAHPADRAKNISELLRIYSSCELVITDRLHGMILSAVTDTPCIAFDNSYHKVSAVYDTWLKNNKSITLSGPIPSENIIRLITQKTSEQYEKYDANIYLSEFDRLTAYLGM